MCGLVGVAGLLSAKEERIFKNLLILDTLRGEHSTGIASVGFDSSVIVAKQVGDPFQLFDTLACENIFRRSNRVLIGHNRYATTGKVSRRNAHPFEFDGLVGAHNGTLTNKHSLTDHNKFDVDSEALYNEINEFGVENAIKKTRGAWALTYWDKYTNTLNFLRNKERPLWFIRAEDNKSIFWASEAWMLTAALHREGYKVKPIQQLPEDMLYSFEIGFQGFKEIPDAKVTVVKGADPYPAYQGGNHFNKTGVAVEQDTQKKSVVVAVAGSVSNAAAHPTLHSTHYDEKYLGKKNVNFELVSIQKDENSSMYVVLFDPDNPSYDVRLYYNQSKEIPAAIGRWCKGSIGSTCVNNGKPYYKVSPWSVEILPINSLDEDFYEPVDHNGKEVTKEEFEKKYHTCGWCSASIQYGELCNILDASGSVVCKDCMVEPSVMGYLK